MQYEVYMKIKQEVEELNSKYCENDFNGSIVSGENFVVIQGTRNIMLSAPHAVKQYFGDQIKLGDKNTGGIVEYLCKKTGAFGITRIFNLGDNPNSDLIGPGLDYKEKILEVIRKNDIKCLIDVHGAKDTYPFHIDIGTNDGINIQYDKKITEIFLSSKNPNITVLIDDRFKAGKNGNISKYVSERTNIPCIQIEICKSLRETNERLLESLIYLENCINQIC